MNNNELIQQARELCDAATPGPWKSKETADYSEIYGNHSWGKALRPLAMVGSNFDDSAFIAASRALVPQLCDALEAAQKEIERLKKHAENLRLDYVDLLARAEKAEAERDAAIEDMKIIVETASECNVCKHRVGVSGCPIRYKECKFEWRGPQEAGKEKRNESHPVQTYTRMV